MTTIQEVLQDLSTKGASVLPISNKFYDLHALEQVLKHINEAKSEDKRKHVGALVLLLQTCPQVWIEEYIRLFNSSSNMKMYSKNISLLLQFGCVLSVKNNEHHQFERSDFPHAAEDAVRIMSLAERLLDTAFLESVKGVHFISSVLGKLTIVLLQHRQETLWSTPESVQKSRKIMEKLRHHFQITDDAALLTMDTCNFITDKKHPEYDHEATLLSLILKELSSVLTKEKWKMNPAMVNVFTSVLFMTKFPDLSNHIVQVLPPALMFVDDYIMDNKILGVRCLHHIITNTSKEELRWYGRADVVYEALKHQLYSHKDRLIEVLHPALLAILTVVEKDPCSALAGGDNSVNKYDEIYQMMVHDAEGEQNLDLRKAFTKHLQNFVQVMGITVVKHLKISLALIENYLEVYDGSKDSARGNVLSLLEKLIQVAWPRIPCHQDNILKMLIKLLIDISSDQSDSLDSELKDELISKSTRCMCLLKFTSEESVCESLSTLKSVQLPKLVHLTIDHVIKAENI